MFKTRPDEITAVSGEPHPVLLPHPRLALLVSRSDILKSLTYTLTGNVIRLSEETSKAAGYLDLVDPDATPLVPAFAIALRREIFCDAGVFAHSLGKAVEIRASDPQREWSVGRVSPSTATMAAVAHETAYGEVEPTTVRK